MSNHIIPTSSYMSTWVSHYDRYLVFVQKLRCMFDFWTSKIKKTFIKSLVFTIILILRKKYFDKDSASYKKISIFGHYLGSTDHSDLSSSAKVHSEEIGLFMCGFWNSFVWQFLWIVLMDRNGFFVFNSLSHLNEFRQ